MNADSKFYQLLFKSPWFLLIFIIIPALVILSIRLHIGLPAVGPTPLLVNNICFALLVACRFIRYCFCFLKSIRYGTAYHKPRQRTTLSLTDSGVRTVLQGAGYTFDCTGNYAEKRDSGYLGTTILYAGMLILLAVGSWDNLRKFSGVLLDGMGPATSLNKIESYRSTIKGLLPVTLESLPRMQITNQFLPDSSYPRGATEITLISADGKAQKKLLKPSEPFSYGSFDIYMSKLVFEPQIVIKTKDAKILFDEIVRLDPLVQKRGPYSFYGLFQGIVLGGGVYYQPEKSTLMVVISRGGEKEVADMTFQVDQQVEKGDYLLSCAKMGQWSEIHVVHRRHKGLQIFGGFLAFFGLLIRLAVRPQRVWFESAADGCTVRTSGKATQELLSGK